MAPAVKLVAVWLNLGFETPPARPIVYLLSLSETCSLKRVCVMLATVPSLVEATTLSFLVWLGKVFWFDSLCCASLVYWNS